MASWCSARVVPQVVRDHCPGGLARPARGRWGRAVPPRPRCPARPANRRRALAVSERWKGGAMSSADGCRPALEGEVGIGGLQLVVPRPTRRPRQCGLCTKRTRPRSSRARSPGRSPRCATHKIDAYARRPSGLPACLYRAFTARPLASVDSSMYDELSTSLSGYIDRISGIRRLIWRVCVGSASD